MKHVIIGAGPAGITAAKTIRERDNNAEVVVIGEERFFPYKRYLLREFLCDCIEMEELIYFPSELLKKSRIIFRKGQYVKTVIPSEKAIKLFHNEVVHYDKLLITTGGTPRLGPVLRPFKKYIHRFYSLKDVIFLKEKLPNIQTCIVSGNGLSSLDLICGLHMLGKRIIYIIKGEHADFGLEEPGITGELQKLLEEKGIEIIKKDQIISIVQSKKHYQVETLKQRTFSPDIIFAWDYYKPNIDCIKNTEISRKLGILVNKRLETSVADIYASGDCVEIYHPGVRNYWINFGWTNAVEQGGIAGKNMTGQKEAYKIHDVLILNLMGKSLKARWWR